MTRTRKAVLAAAAALGALLFPEAAYWAGAKACPSIKEGGTCALLVLGSPSWPDGTLTPMQRHRMATAIELIGKARCEAMVISGGKPHSIGIESQQMGQLAQDAGVPSEKILLETQATNTWENVQFSLPKLERFDPLYIVSDSLHVHRGVRYLCKQRPDLCARTSPYSRYRFGEFYVAKVKGVFHETAVAIRDLFR